MSDEHIVSRTLCELADCKPEMEVARNWSSQDLPVSHAQTRTSNSPQWINESDDFDNPPGGTGSGMTTPVGLNTPRVSLMTPRERS